MSMQKRQIRRQRGGTLMGFVVGLLVGLASALAVAIYVTKVPVPFVDRGLSRNPAQDAAEAERNKGWNPNASLNGNSATGAVVPAVPGTEAPGAIIVPPADGRNLPAPGAAPSGADPLGDLARSRMDQDTTAAVAASADPFTYFVQAGAFRTVEDAEAQKAKLAMLGIEAQISEREQSGRTVYRVRVGPFSQRSLAEVTREQLEVNGVVSALVRVQR